METKRIALYPGSFDPFTLGHKVIVEQSLRLFDEIVIAIGENSNKRPFLSIEKRIKLIEQCFPCCDNVKVISYKGLTAEYCRKNDINFIVRGVRNTVDFEFERSIAGVNKKLNPNIENVFLMTPVEFSEISSTVVREIVLNGGDPSEFMPKEISLKDLKNNE
ncbi:MAG: pantetheine-phosphate adenylyltransferase [Rikenellaceae bacterium]